MLTYYRKLKKKKSVEWVHVYGPCEGIWAVTVKLVTKGGRGPWELRGPSG